MMFKNKHSLTSHLQKHAVQEKPCVAAIVQEQAVKPVEKQNIPAIVLQRENAHPRKKPKINLLFPDVGCFRDIPELSRCLSFVDWLNMYRRLVSDTNDVQMAESTLEACVGFIEQLPSVECDTSLVFADYVDDFVDKELLRVNMATVTQRLRFLKWYLLYKVSTDHDLDLSMVEDLNETICTCQAAATKTKINDGLFAIADPYPLARLGNSIVHMLRKEQVEVINPTIVHFYKGRLSDERMVEFGVQHLRQFLELAMRFVNVPLRIQCTTSLKLDAQDTDFVCKLVYRGNHFARVVCRDKTGAMLTTVPLDQELSFYVSFYILHCRFDKNSEYVFQTSRGKQWTKASRDLKVYMSQRGIVCDEVCPNGRFVHCSRNIGLAKVAIMSNFDTQKLEAYSVLLRNSLHMIEHVYSPWLRLRQARDACDTMFLYHNIPSVYKCAPVFECVALEALAGEILFYLRNTMAHYLKPEEKFAYTTRTCGTQTGDCKLVVAETDEIKKECLVCQSVTVYCGPCGKTTHSKFACYFRACLRCNPKKTSSHSTNVWYKLGETNPAETSQSSKPRNLDVILKHIQDNK
jgi:hypothetical protein